MKAVKQRMQDQGLKPVHVKHAVLLIVADAYLDLHRDELLAEAAERIAAWPDFRKMAEQEAKRRVKAIQKTSLQRGKKLNGDKGTSGTSGPYSNRPIIE